MPASSLTPRLSLLREQRYRKYFLLDDKRQNAIVMAVLSVAIGAASVTDFLLLRGSSLMGVALGARVLYCIANGFALVLLRRAQSPQQQDRAVDLSLFALALGTVVVHLTRIPSGHIQGPLIGTGTLISIVYFAQRGPVGPRVLAGCVLGISPMVPVLLGSQQVELAPAGRVTAVVSLVALNVLGIVSARSFEEQRRRRFEAERHERHARQALAINLRALAIEKDRALVSSRARATFLAAMSHEFRTPMNAVIGLSDALLDAPLAPEHRAHVRTINDSARALLAQLEEILDFAKIDAQKVTLFAAPFDLPRLAASVVDMLRPAAESRSLDLSLDLAPDLPEHLIGDDARLRQVLVNLVSNAIKFTERGAIRLEITAGALDDGIHEIAFRVEDTGIGMAPSMIARLFRPFEQADEGISRRFGGTGLGLAISDRIVAAMGGNIHVESEPGHGSVVSFTLRLAAAAPPPPVIAPAQLEDRPLLAILVVDDDPINRIVARATLGRLGYEADVVGDGREAVVAVSNKDYDVVLMDLQMPGMNGIEAAQRIREATPGKRAPQVVAMTASVFEEDREACRQAGMRDFVAKPVDIAQVEAVLRRVAERAACAR